MRQVLWIGGGQGSGKTSIARAIAHGYDVQAYHGDAFMFAHVDRMRHGPFPEMQRFLGLTMDERWLEPSPPEMLSTYLRTSEERFPLVLEDLRGMPGTPLVVAEGPHLLPQLVHPHLASPDRAVWLVPTERFQRESLAARIGSAAATTNPQRAHGNAVERNLLISAEIRSQAKRLALRVVDVDGERDLDAVTALVEEQFAAALAEGPTARGPDERRRIRRAENEVAVRQISAYLRSGEAPPQDEEPRYPFACECTRPGCAERVELPVFELEALLESGGRFLVADAHRDGDRPGEASKGLHAEDHQARDEG